MAKILCVDDDPDILATCRMILSSDGHEVETADNGTAGLEKAKSWQPDCIVLDVMMTTDTEGFHAAYAIRQDETLQHTPILMLTSINETTNAKFDPDKDGEFLPVDAFIEKPVTPDNLKETVKKLLALTDGEINIAGRKQIL
ncbi:MAG TPA: response regulator [bacterium]|nr:response regulator [bacterium]